MVAINDLTKVNQLYQEQSQIERALSMLDGGRITAFVISKAGSTGLPPLSVTVPTESMEYPPQMIETIKSMLEEQYHHVLDELSGLGVTGVETR